MPRYYYPNARSTADGTNSIKLTWLKKQKYLTGDAVGVLNWSHHGKQTGSISIRVCTVTNPRIELAYKIKKREAPEHKEVFFCIPMEKDPCQYGGFKWFFVCGLERDEGTCENRARILYRVGDYFGCRKCANLSYKSCNESKKFRSGAFRILTRGWDAKKYYEQNVRRESYKNRPTKKYLRFLRIQNGYSEKDIALLKLDAKNLGKYRE